MRTLPAILVFALWALGAAAQPVVTAPAWPGGRPYFHAYLSGNQSVSNATATKVQFDTTTGAGFDSGGYWATAGTSCSSSGAYCYTPLVAGKYLVHAHISLSGSGTGGQQQTYIYKNGASVSNSSATAFNTNTFGITMDVVDIIAMNGTTDYLEGWASVTAATSPTVVGTAPSSYIEATYLGP